MGKLWQDVRGALRMMRKRPGLTLAAVVTLAVGIGANTAVFSVVNAVLLRPLPFPQQERLFRIVEFHKEFGRVNLTGATFADLAERDRSFAHVAAYRRFPLNLAGEGSKPTSVVAAAVSGQFFSVLNVTPLAGRLLVTEDFRGGAEQAVVLSQQLWVKVYGSDPRIVGRRLRLDGRPCIVVGILPARFRFPDSAELWVPLTRPQSLPLNRRAHLFVTLGRRMPAVPELQAQTELSALAQQIDWESGGIDHGLRIAAIPLREEIVGAVRPTLLVLLGAVGFLLLIACANVATLVLAHGVAREKELAIRAALGAGRGRLAAQLLTENVLLSLVGTIPALLLAVWGLKILPAIAPREIPRLGEVSVDLRVLVFSLLLAALAGVFAGLWPAIHAARADLQAPLRESHIGPGRERHWRAALVISEVALGLVLLSGAVLLGRSFLALLHEDLGFRVGDVLTFFLSPDAKYKSSSQAVAFYDEVLEHLRALPGARAVAASNSLPSNGCPSTSFEVQGRPTAAGEAELEADVITVSPGYFRLMGIPLREGRAFQERDIANAPVVVVLSEFAARTFFPNQDPLGKRITMKDWSEPLPGVVVGVVGDAKMGGPGNPVHPTVYYDYGQFGDRVLGMYFLIGTAADPRALALSASDSVWSVNKDQPLADVLTLRQVLARSIAEARFRTLFLGIFAALALLLVVVGIYSVVSYSVGERTREIGIRVALGAQGGDILRLVLREGMGSVSAGIALGLAGAAALTQGLRSLLYGVTPGDPFTFVGVVLLLGIVSLVACYLPARRAMRIDPVEALRDS